jgi:LEA14-like dessication related protein
MSTTYELHPIIFSQLFLGAFTLLDNIIKKRDKVPMKNLQIIVLSSLLLSCAALNKMMKNSTPTIKTGNVTVEKLTFDGVELLLDLHVTNPNPIDIPLTGLAYEVMMNGKSILSGKKKNNPTITANTTSTIQIPFQIPFSIMKTITSDLFSKDVIKLDVQTELFFSIPVIGEKSVSFNASPEIPIPKVPTLTVSKFRKKNVSLTGATLVFDMELNNPNIVALNLNELDYAFSLSENELLKSGISKQITIPKKSKATIPVEFKVNFIKAGMVLYNILQGDRSLDYAINGTFNLNLDIPYFPAVKQNYHSTGKLSTN